MSILLTDIEAASMIGGYYKTDTESTTKRRMRELIRTSGVQYIKKDREVYLHKHDVNKLIDALPWQSNPQKEKTPRIGGSGARLGGNQYTGLQELLMPTSQGRQKSLTTCAIKSNAKQKNKPSTDREASNSQHSNTYKAGDRQDS